MADSKVTIKIDADAEGAKRAFAEVQQSADAAMESGARSAQKLSKSLDGVAESAKTSSAQLRATARALSGVAVGLAVSALNRPGENESTGAALLKGGLSSGLSAGLMSRNIGVGFIAGAYGVYDAYQKRKELGEQQAQGVGDTADALAKMREEMDRVYERTNDFEKLLETLGNTEADAASRANLLSDAIAKRKQEEADATERMKAAEAAMRAFKKTIDGPMDKGQEKYFTQLKEDWDNASKDLTTARAELKQLDKQKIEKDKPNYDTAGTNAERFGSLLSGLEKAGIGFAALETNAIAAKHAKGWGFVSDYYEGGPGDASTKVAENTEKANDIAEKTLEVLESIDAKTTGEPPTAVFA